MRQDPGQVGLEVAGELRTNRSVTLLKVWHSGIAVLRYEKRTKQYHTLMALSANTITVKEETVDDDALAAVETVSSEKKIDRSKIFVLGHSLGGSVLPRIGQGNQDIAGLISLAGSTRPLGDIVLEQVRSLALQVC